MRSRSLPLGRWRRCLPPVRGWMRWGRVRERDGGCGSGGRGRWGAEQHPGTAAGGAGGSRTPGQVVDGMGAARYRAAGGDDERGPGDWGREENGGLGPSARVGCSRPPAEGGEPGCSGGLRELRRCFLCSELCSSLLAVPAAICAVCLPNGSWASYYSLPTCRVAH